MFAAGVIIGLGALLSLFVHRRENNITEGFVWSRETIDKFKTFQRQHKDRVQYNMKILQEQASEQDALDLINDGHWPWSDAIKQKYKKVVEQSPIMKTPPGEALAYNQAIYPQTAMEKMLFWNSPEGKFALHGGNIGSTVTSGLYHVPNTLTCEYIDSMAQNEPQMVKTEYTGYNVWNGFKNSIRKIIQNKDIPDEMPGFQFNGAPCNPCGALENDFSCDFKINIKRNEP